MKNTSIDTVLLVKLRHEPGHLARVATAIAEEGGLLNEITTLRIADDHTLREITVETDGTEQAARVQQAVRAVGADIVSSRDRVLDAHRGGKVRVVSRSPLESLRDLRTIYTPGVAQVVRAIREAPERAWDLTWRANTIGMFTDGTRVLGLGAVGPLAALPVMEGKAVLYDRLIGISALPLVLDAPTVADFVETVVRASAGLAAVHLEDIRSPECFEIEARIRERVGKPVFHDDQHGTATAVLAALINAARLTGIALPAARIGVIGLGAAGTAIASLVARFGVGEVLAHDPDPEATRRALRVGARSFSFDRVLTEADVVVAATGRGGLIPPDAIRRGQIVFALSNPVPEIDPRSALEAGAALASDGRSINNALAFPGLMRGALLSRSRSISSGMMIEAARVIAAHAEDDELTPAPLDPELHQDVARAVAARASAEGLTGTASP